MAAAFITTARTWKEPKCPTADDFIEAIVYTMEYVYVTIRKHEIV